MMTKKQVKELWKQVLAQKKNEPAENDVMNILNEYDVTTVLATIKFFRHEAPMHDWFLQQIQWDLRVAKYRIFDWMGMFLNGFFRVHKDEPFSTRRDTLWIMQTLAEKYVEFEGNAIQWIDHFRRHDYQLEYTFRGIGKEVESCMNCSHAPDAKNTAYVGEYDEPICLLCSNDEDLCEYHITNSEDVRLEKEQKAMEKSMSDHQKEVDLIKED